MAVSELLRLIVQADTQGAVRGLEQVGKSADKNLHSTEARLDRTAQKMQKFGTAAVVAGTVVATGLFKAGEAASDLGETVSQSEQIFGSAAGGIGSFAKDAATSLGQSERAAREAANTFGLFFTNAGKSQEEAAGMSIELAKLASDMASFKNTSPEQAVEALGAALRGESEPIRQYGVMLDDATLKQRALDMGLIQTTSGTLPPAIKMQAAYAEILAQTTTIQGDFARTSEGMANQQRILNAEFENAKASLGQAVAPILADIMGKASGAARAFTELNEETDGAVGKLVTYGTIGLVAVGGTAMIAGKVIELRKAFQVLDPATGASTGQLNKLGKVTAGLTFVATVAGLVAMGREMSKIQLSSEDLTRALDDTTRAGREKFRTYLALADAEGELENIVRDAADANVDQAEDLVAVARSAGISKDKIAELKEIVDKKRKADEEAAPAVDEYGNATDTAAGKVDDLNTAVRTLEDALKDQMSLFNSDIAYERSIDGAKKAVDELTWVTAAGKTGTEEFDTALLDAKEAMLDQAEAAAKLAEDQALANGQTFTAKDRTNVYLVELTKLRDSLKKGSPLRKALDEYIWTLAAIPGTVETEVSVKLGQSVMSGVGNFLAGLPKFDNGGVMPGPRGKHSLALVAGGETVVPTHKTTTVEASRQIVFGEGSIVLHGVTDAQMPTSLARELRSLTYQYGAA